MYVQRGRKTPNEKGCWGGGRRVGSKKMKGLDLRRDTCFHKKNVKKYRKLESGLVFPLGIITKVVRTLSVFVQNPSNVEPLVRKVFEGRFEEEVGHFLSDCWFFESSSCFLFVFSQSFPS